MFRIDRGNLNFWIIPAAASALLFTILLFIFPFNSGDTSYHAPLGFALWSIWTSSSPDAPDHTYCLLVPPMVAYLLYEKRKYIWSATAKGSTASAGWIVLGLLLFWIGSRAGKQYIGCVGIQVLVLGLIHWFWGAAVFRRLLFAWAIIAFAWPLPFLDTAVAFPMRMLVSRTAHLVLNLVGIPCLQDGTALISGPTPGAATGAKFQIDIADPCSGLHSLLPLLMFSAFYCYFFLPKRWQQWTVFASSFFFTIAGNVVRILMLVMGTLLWGTAFAIGTDDVPSAFHEGCGFAVFIIVLGSECLLGYLLVSLDRRYSAESNRARPRPEPEKVFGSIVPGVSEGSTIPLWRSVVVFGLAALAALVYAVSPPVYLPSEAGVVMSLPEQVSLADLDGGHFYGTDAPVSEVEHRLLPKDTEFSRKNYDDFHEHKVFFSIVLSGVQQYTIHPPEVCLVAQGWTIAGQADIPIKLASGHQLVVRNLSLQRELLDSNRNRHQVKAYYMYWYVADDLTTPSHLERNLRSSWDRIFHNRDHRWAYVIAMAPITETLFAGGQTAEQTRDMLTAFIREIVPEIQIDEFRGGTNNS